jgi:hypothetical protein
MKKLAAGAATIGAAALVAMNPTPAQAQPTAVDPGVGGSAEGLVFLEVERGQGLKNAAMLLCPGGDGHDKGVDACAQLTVAEGEFHALPVADGICTKEFDPVTFRAVGFWDGELVVFEEEYSNYCTGVNETGGAVFDIGKP